MASLELLEKMILEAEADDEYEFYPSGDGKPMGETDWHVDLIINGITLLRGYFAGRDDVYVAGNNFIYYEEGKKSRVSPDTYIVFGVSSEQRSSYFTWEDGRAPSVVFEFTSRSTRRQDMGRKYSIYEQVLHVPEYFLFDPTGVRKKVRLKGFRLNAAGVYQPLPLINGRIFSEQLGLELVQDSKNLRFYDPAKGRFLETAEEAVIRADYEARMLREEQRRADNEARMRTEAERRNTELEAEVARLKALYERNNDS